MKQEKDAGSIKIIELLEHICTNLDRIAIAMEIPEIENIIASVEGQRHIELDEVRIALLSIDKKVAKEIVNKKGARLSELSQVELKEVIDEATTNA